MSRRASESGLVLRPATLADAKQIWDCRQALHGSAAIQSASQAETYESHLVWFGCAIADPNRHFMIIEHDARWLGYLRFDPLEDEVSHRVSIALLSDIRGMGFGSSALSIGCLHARQLGIKTLFADIAAENEASRRVFVKCGFVPLEASVLPNGYVRFIRELRSLPGARDTGIPTMERN